MKAFRIFVLMSALMCCAIVSKAQELEPIIHISNQEDIDPQKVVREYVLNETVYGAFLARGFSRNSDGSVDLSADVKFVNPKGEMLANKDWAKAKFNPPADEDVVLLDASYDVQFIPGEDETGMYTLEVTIHDHVSGTQASTETTLLLFDTEESKKLIMSPVKDAEQLDLLWAEYFRSKNPWAVKRIISALSLREGSSSLEQAAISSAAQWSLRSNAQEYPEVLEICKQELALVPETMKPLLQEIIDVK